jgi:phytanoyl-CoA dioxygenase PhyH
MLTSEQREEFDRLGMVRVPGAISPGDAREMCDLVWKSLHRRYQIRRDAPKTWEARRTTGTHDLPKSVTFEKISSPAICEALDDLLGRGNWERPERWGSLLVAFPESRDRWNVPHQSWHLDYPASRAQEALFAVRLFTCLAGLQPGGGGTVFVAGSHRLVQDLVRVGEVETLRSAEARKALIRTCPWVKELCSYDEKADRIQQFMRSAAGSGEVEVRVVEMTGDPGDVLLTHPLLLHAPAKNCAEVPRLVLSSTIFRSGMTWRAINR